MAFCKLGNEFKDQKCTQLENVFIRDYLPYATDVCTKVYIYGLYKCQNLNEVNDLDSFAQELNMKNEDVIECFWYWQSVGLVKVIELNPIEVIYLPCKNSYHKFSKLKEDKYEEFVLAVNGYFEGVRQILPTEIQAYIEVMETYHIDQLALLRIIKYCIEYKDKNVGYPYIVQVAKNWANEGIKNLNAVEEKINDLGLTEAKLLDILKAMHIKRSATLEERQLYIKWTKTLGFDYATIMTIIKLQKSKKGGLNKLDKLILGYFEKKLFSEKEIIDFENSKQELYLLAKNVVNALGLYYEVLDNVIDTYILDWKNKGFDDNTILTIAQICFKTSIRNLEGMDNYIKKLFKQGIVNQQALNEYIYELTCFDDLIYQIFEKLGISRNVKSSDRTLYKVWTKEWNFEQEVLLYVSSMALDKSSPLSYLNKILSNFFKQGLMTIEQVKQNETLISLNKKPQETSKTSLAIQNYSDEQLLAMFDDLDGVKL